MLLTLEVAISSTTTVFYASRLPDMGESTPVTITVPPLAAVVLKPFDTAHS